MAGECGASVRGGAEVALSDPAVAMAVETHAVALQVVDSPRGVAGHDQHGAWVGQRVALPQRVSRMLLPRAGGVGGGQRRVDTAGCQDGVGIVGRALAHRDDRDTGLGDFDGRSKA